MAALAPLLTIACMACLLAAALTDLRSYEIPERHSDRADRAVRAARADAGVRRDDQSADRDRHRVRRDRCSCSPLGGFGAGDGKLLTALTLHLPASLIIPFWVALAIAGPVWLGLVALMRRIRRRVASPASDVGGGADAPSRGVAGWEVWSSARVPYAVAIAAAGLFILAVDLYRGAL